MNLLGRSLAWATAAMLATAGLGACSAQPHQSSQTVTLARGLTVTIPAGAKAAAKPEPAAVHALGGYRPLLKVLASPARITVTGPAVVTFRVHVGAGPRPFIASLADGTWTVVPSTYRAGVLSARIPGDPVLAPLDWLTGPLQAMVREALQSVYSLAATAHDPSCSLNGTVMVSDSNPGHHTVGYCAEPAQALPAGSIVTTFSNERSYPVDLTYPASLGGRCGEYGACLSFPATNDVWVRLGALLSPGQHQVLLPGDAQATAVTRTAAGQAAVFSTAFDAPAMFLGFVESGVKVFTAIMTRGTTLGSAEVTDAVIKGLDGAACLRDGLVGSSLPVKLATSAFACIGAMLPEILLRLGFTKLNMAADAFETATGFAVSLLASISGNLDSVTGASHHVFVVHGPPLGTVTPTAADTYLAEGQNTAGVPLHAPACASGCALSGDATSILEHMTWSSWTGTGAVGTGMEHLEDCSPTCAGGGQYLVPVVVTFSHPVRDCAAQSGSGSTVLGGTRWFWSEASFRYPQGLPKALQGANAPQNPWVFTALIAQAQQSCG